LKFKYPDIDEYIANFEDLIVHVGYNLASKEAINLFLKGFSKNRNLLDKVFTSPVLTAYGTMKRHLIPIVKLIQLVNSIAQNVSPSGPSLLFLLPPPSPRNTARA
jgi:hypothetical protein